MYRGSSQCLVIGFSIEAKICRKVLINRNHCRKIKKWTMEGWSSLTLSFVSCLFYLDSHQEVEFILKVANQIGTSTGEKNPSSHPRVWPVRGIMNLLGRTSQEFCPHLSLGSCTNGISLMFLLRTVLPHILPWEPSAWESPGPRSHEWASLDVELGSASFTSSPCDSTEHPGLGTTVLGHLSWRQVEEKWAINTGLMHVSY